MQTWHDLVKLDDSRFRLNGSLQSARNKTMLAVLGSPRGSYSDEDQEPTNPSICGLLISEDFGPFKVRGLKPAVSALRTILEDVRQAEPTIYSRLGSAGMLCCRLVRGSTCSISNHSWGTAVDLRIDGVLDKRGDNQAQQGLLRIHPYFNRHGFYWGAAFPVEDSMHFEASDQLVREWQSRGHLGGPARPISHDSILEFGDRGSEVMEFQQLLCRALSLDLTQDGIFGTATRAAVIDFQARNSLTPDGIVGADTMATLQRAAH